MEQSQLTEELKKIILPILAREDLELVELNFTRAGAGASLRLLIDTKEGGINLAECAKINQKVGVTLDECGILEERYVLEVSSPGLDRPLRVKEDFSRCIGRQAKFFLDAPINGKIEIDADILAVTEDEVLVNTKNGTTAIPLALIIKAKQIIR